MTKTEQLRQLRVSIERSLKKIPGQRSKSENRAKLKKIHGYDQLVAEARAERGPVSRKNSVRHQKVEFENPNLVEVKRVRDAIGAKCVDCGEPFSPETQLYGYNFKKWKASHERDTEAQGSIHKVVYYGSRQLMGLRYGRKGGF